MTKIMLFSVDPTTMGAAFPFLAAAGLASRSPFSHQSLGNGLPSSSARVPTGNAMFDFHTQTILNMFRSAQQQQQTLLKVSL